MAACTALAAAARRTAEAWARDYEAHLRQMGSDLDVATLNDEARAAARRALEDARPGRLVVSRALRRHWVRWAGDPSGIELIQGPTEPDVLLLEDLGTENADQHWSSAFGEMFDLRMCGGQNQKTVITTNLSPEAIRKRYGERIYSRMVGTGAWVHVKGPDLRLEGCR